jgi:hypothetical protein
VKITVDMQRGSLDIGAAVFKISCNVRTLKDGARSMEKKDVAKSIPDNLPYDPRPFPKGLWNVVGVEWQKEKGFDYNTYGPVKIRTDAWQWANAWELDKAGNYFRETGKKVKDAGYLLHYSKSGTTLGCIRLASPEDAEKIARVIERVLSLGGEVALEVI